MSNTWGSYEARISAKGSTIRTAKLQRESSYLSRKLPSSLSYHTVTINGVERQLAIIDSDNLETKTICSLPGEDILGGSLIVWNGDNWLVIQRDPNNEVYTKAIMAQCNYLLRWIAADETIIERWCIISDGTKYLTGETISSYNDNGMSLGDTRIAMTVPRDEYTVQLNRSHRFLIDDYDSGNVLAYRLTKPFKLGGVYNNHGAMSFVLTEVNTEDSDNLILHIANYYEHFPHVYDNDGVEVFKLDDDYDYWRAEQESRDNTPGNDTEDEPSGGGKKVWL